MEVWIMDANETPIELLDAYSDFIWTDRFLGYGDFELHLPMEHAPMELLVPENRLARRGSNREMIIENVSITSDVEEGIKVVVTGKSLESILYRRIVGKSTILEGNLQNGIQKLLNENVINPTDAKRRINGFVFTASMDPRITELTVDAQYLGENLYEVIEQLCLEVDIGFKILPNGSGGFEFSLYAGEDRSYDQEENPYVVFSPKFDNLRSSNYVMDTSTLKNAALIGGDGEGPDRTLVWAEDTEEKSGLDRREIFEDAYDISKTIYDNDGNTSEIPDVQYRKLLLQKGYVVLAENSVIDAFDGEIDATRQFVYGTDFEIGDVVQIENEFGMSNKSRIIELVYSHNVNGEALYPTFSSAY